MVTANGRECWSISPEKYCKATVLNVEQKLNKEGKRLPTKCKTPVKIGYCSELAVSRELKADGVQYYMKLIGVLRWTYEIGQVDIIYETSIMSTHLALPRVGHLEELFHIFGYLKENIKRKIAFYPDHPLIDKQQFKKHDWYEFYRDAKEAILGNMPPTRGNGVTMHCFENADLAGNTVTRRSQTGILIFINRDPIIWHSKRQNTVEASTYGSEIGASTRSNVECKRYGVDPHLGIKQPSC